MKKRRDSERETERDKRTNAGSSLEREEAGFPHREDLICLLVFTHYSGSCVCVPVWRVPRGALQLFIEAEYTGAVTQVTQATQPSHRKPFSHHRGAATGPPR